MYETIVFDLDGTLLDTLDDLHASVVYTLTQFGLKTRTKDEVRAFIGNGIKKLIQRSVGDSAVDLDALVGVFKTHYAQHCKDKTKPYDGVMETLALLKEKGVKLAVVSNKADFAVKLLADEYFKGYIDVAVGENEGAGIRKKPAPDSLLSVMQTLGADRNTTVYVGDSEVDIQTAQNAGVDCISVLWGFKDKEFLMKNGATALVETPMQILRFCKE